MLREAFSNNPGALTKLIEIFAEDAASLATEGLEISGHRIWFLHLGTKGDLPALSKLGSFNRTFLNVPRAPSSKKRCLGVCHQCMAGQEGDGRGTRSFPYEDLSMSPEWLQTLDQKEPWVSEPAILKGLPINIHEKSQFFCFDLWHIFSLGIAKHYIASCFVVLIESQLAALAPFRSVEAKFKFVTQHYRDFCKSKKFAMWVGEIGRESLQWPQGSATPIGRWNKGSASTTLMLFLSHFCDRFVEGHTDDEALLLIVSWLGKPASFNYIVRTTVHLK